MDIRGNSTQDALRFTCTTALAGAARRSAPEQASRITFEQLSAPPGEVRMTRMREFRILGPLEVLLDGRPVELGGLRQRALLAALLVHHGQVVSTERLVDLIW